MEKELQPRLEKKYEEKIVRILSQDIEGKMKIYPSLAKLKGVSWSLSNAICKMLNIDKNRKIGSLTNEEVSKISDFIKKIQPPGYLANRKRDPETGADRHLVGVGLELQKEFDIKRLKKIKSYRGYRHAAGLPTRGQRTKGHFRKNKGKGGVKKKVRKNEKKT